MRYGFDVRSILVTAAIVASFSAPGSTGVVRKLTDSKNVSFDWAMPDGTGSEIFVATSSDQFTPGGNPEHVFQIAVFDPVTGIGTQLTSFASSLTHVRHNLSVSEDGLWLAFISHGDLVPGQNGDRNPEVFVLDRNTSQLTQLTNDATPSPGSVTRVALSGSGNRVAFASNSDLTGGNPQRVSQVFVIDRNGGNLAQLTNAASGSVDHMWISDDGNRIAFSHNGDLTGGNADRNVEVFTIAIGDALPRQITSSTTGNSTGANISGDGSTIVFESTANLTGGNADGGLEIFAAEWTSGTISQITTSTGTGGGRQSRQPWPTDDGQVIFFASDQSPVAFVGIFEVFKINKNGTGKTKITNFFLNTEHPVVSGGGERFAVWMENSLRTATGTGANPITLIDRVVRDQGYPDITPDGTRMCFATSADPLGTNPAGSPEAFVMQTDGTGLTQVTPTGNGARRLAMDGAGTRIYYESTGDPLGQNPDRNGEVFGINVDGTGLIQYTSGLGPNGEFSGYSEVSDDGSTIVFASVCDLTGGNADMGGELFRVDPDGQNLTQLTSFPSPTPFERYVYWPRLDATGTWVAFSGTADIAGGNPDGGFEVWRMRTDGTGLQQLTSDPVYYSLLPDISADGARIVFESQADLIGQNADHNYEIFLYEPGSATTQQLTQTTSGDSFNPRLSRDGRYVDFVSTARFGEGPVGAGRLWLYRYDLDTDTLERAGGLAFEDSALFEYWPAVDSDGSMVAYSSQGDPTGLNPDDYWELQVVDYAAPNPPVVSSGPAPTTVSFRPEPGAFLYDVIRGNVEDLATDGVTVDLGAVTCVENNSGDTTTAGYADPDTPAPGQAFFYLFRGSKGADAGPGSYGKGSNGAERVAGAGDCGS